MNPETIDLVIVAGLEAFRLLGKIAKGEPITDEDLRLETWQQTADRIRTEAAVAKGGTT